MKLDNLLKKIIRRKQKRAEWQPSNRAMSFDVIQTGNCLQIRADNFLVDIEVKGIELPPAIDASFAVWLLLPLAMSRGFDLRINRPLDPKVIENAEQLSTIWEMWAPGRFSSIRVVGTDAWRPPLAGNDRYSAVGLYSGGVDSTYSIVRHASSISHALTVHGQDYEAANPLDEDRFARLLTQTQPLLDELGLQRVVVRTTLREYIRAGRLTHGFLLAGYTFLLSHQFREGLIAADFTPVQDMISSPWGTNHVSNQYFAGSDFAMRTVCSESYRSEKIAFIAQNETALRAVSFCHNPDIKPERCGVCRKCIRSKAMFVAATGSCPNIFLDMTLTAKHIASLGVERRNGRAALADLYACAKRNNRLDQIPGLAELHSRFSAMSKF